MNESRPLAIGQLLTALWPGGLERFVLSLAEEMPRERYRFVVYAWMAENPWKEAFLRLGVPVRELGAPNRIRTPLDILRFLRAWLELSALLRDDGIDVLQTHDFLAPCTTSTTGGRTGCSGSIGSYPRSPIGWYASPARSGTTSWPGRPSRRTAT